MTCETKSGQADVCMIVLKQTWTQVQKVSDCHSCAIQGQESAGFSWFHLLICRISHDWESLQQNVTVPVFRLIFSSFSLSVSNFTLRWCFRNTLLCQCNGGFWKNLLVVIGCWGRSKYCSNMAEIKISFWGYVQRSEIPEVFSLLRNSRTMNIVELHVLLVLKPLFLKKWWFM